MKKILPIVIAIMYAGLAISQTTNTSQTLGKEDYLKKSKHQKTAAWILLGTGILSSALGSVQVNPDYGESENSNSKVFLIAGLAAIGASIPLFISSSKNRKKANSISLIFYQLPDLHQKNIASAIYPAIAFKLLIK